MIISTIIKSAYADEPLDPITGLGTGYQTEAAIGTPLTTAETLLSNVAGFLTVAGGVTFMIYIILAGLTWITAREEAERISKAKQMFTNAVVGLAIVAIAWAFTGVMETIFGFNILSPKQTLKGIMSGGAKPPDIPTEALEQFFGQ